MRTLLRIAAVTAALVLVTGTAARATEVDLYVGGSYNSVTLDGYGTVGGGSFDVSTLNGATLDYLYCLDLTTYIDIPGLYDKTDATTDGTVHGGTAVVNANKVAYILWTYGGYANTAEKEAGIQAAIWHYVWGSTLSASNAAAVIAQYNTIVADVDDGHAAVALDNFYWLSPDKTNPTRDKYQALITSKSGGSGIVPEGGSLALLLTGIAPLGYALRRRAR